MDPNDYLNTDPSRLRVIDLKRAITEFGGVPEERATKATLIKQFAQLRSNYLRTVSRGHEAVRNQNLLISEGL